MQISLIFLYFFTFFQETNPQERGNYRFFTPGDFAVYGVSNGLGQHLGVTVSRLHSGIH